MAQRVCTECGHIESEHTFFCTVCGAKTVESSLANERSETKSYHNRDLKELLGQKNETEVKQQFRQANYEKSSKSAEKTINPSIPTVYKRLSIVGIVVGGFALIVLVASLVTKKPWGANTNDGDKDNPVKTEQTVASDISEEPTDKTTEPKDVVNSQAIEDSTPPISGKTLFIDDADLFSDAEKNSIRSLVEEKSYEANMDIVVLTVNSTSGKNILDFADDYYDYNGYGVGETKDGLIFVLAMEDRGLAISTSGRAIERLTDAEQDKIMDAFSSTYQETGIYSAVVGVVNDFSKALSDSYVSSGQDRQIDDIDTESEVVVIRDKYNEIMSLIQGNACKEVEISKDITGYISDEVDAIYVKKGYDDYNYSRKYYYDNGELIFAYFEANDAHRLYFKNDRLFRWRYSQNAADAQNAVNHDADNADGYDSMEIFAIKEAYSLLTRANVDANDKPIGMAVVNAPDGGVNLRSGPGTEYEILVNMIPNGTEMKIYQLKTSSKGTPWGYTKYNSTEGWIALSQVDYNDMD